VTELVVAFVAGIAIGAAYFAALWWTVRDLHHARRPAARLTASTVVRLALVVGAFWLVMNGESRRLLACLAGFITARFVAMRIVRHSSSQTRAMRPDTGKASAGSAQAPSSTAASEPSSHAH